MTPRAFPAHRNFPRPRKGPSATEINSPPRRTRGQFRPADAASGLIPLALFLGPLRHLHGRVLHPPRTLEAGRAGGYRTILRSPAVRWLTLLTFVATFIGYGQFEVGLPAFARGEADFSGAKA